jgi:hypothetical protein
MVAIICGLLYVLWCKLLVRMPTLEGMDGGSSTWLCDFHVKTAFNACAESHERNAVISTTQLKSVITKGYRCLDFEIHPLPVTNAPVVASSVDDSMTEWGSKNTILFSAAMNEIKMSGFVSSSSPLFINLRIKSTDPDVMNKVSESLDKYLSGRMLKGVSRLEVNTVPAEGKIIVMVDATNNGVTAALKQSDLDERANIVFSSKSMKALKMSELIAVADPVTYEKNTRNQFSIIYPEMGQKNPKPDLALSYGCQFIGMQVSAKTTIDVNLDTYDGLFKNSAHPPSRLLKPESKRHVPALDVTIPSGPEVEAKKKVISDGVNAIADVGNF